MPDLRTKESRPMKIPVHFYAKLRETFQARRIDVEMKPGATVGDLLESICPTAKKRNELFAGADLKPYIIILINGRHIQHLEGLASPIKHGDVISVFPPIAGG